MGQFDGGEGGAGTQYAFQASFSGFDSSAGVSAVDFADSSTSFSTPMLAAMVVEIQGQPAWCDERKRKHHTGGM